MSLSTLGAWATGTSLLLYLAAEARPPASATRPARATPRSAPARLASARFDTPCDPATTRPVAGTDQLTTTAGQALRITPAQLLANDTDPQNRALRLGDVSKPAHGTLATNADGSYTYTPTPGYSGPDAFTYVLQLAGPVLAAPATGHYYEFVSAPGSCWVDARAAAAARTYQGMTGYLATITSAAETGFLTRRADGQFWFGASDAAVEGEWRWQTGPEAGQLFWRGNATGTAVAYSNWSTGEPNNYQNPFRTETENYGQLYGNSLFWNDLTSCGTGATVTGYLVEYGGLEACTPVLYAIGTVSINGGTPLATQAPGASVSFEAVPNPSDGHFRVRVAASNTAPAQLDLFDVQGRLVRPLFAGQLRAGELREIAVEAPELAAGLYLVRLQSGDTVQVLRVALVN